MSATDKLNIVLVGVGGYGRMYLKELVNNGDSKNIHISGVIQPTISKYPYLEDLLEEKDIPVYKKLEDFYNSYSADLAIISSPIQYHYEQICTALNNNTNVLCEKPATSSVEEAMKIDELSKRVGKFVAIGYQLSFNEAVLNLKKDILSGKFGKALCLKTLLLSPRSVNYYTRNSWAGKKKDNEGNMVLDSIAHNAGSHNIHNMLYIIGDSIENSAKPVMLEAELYRANDIENFDSVAARIIISNGTKILFYGSHSSEKKHGLKYLFEFEKGTVKYNEDVSNNLIAYMRDGTTIDYGDPTSNVLNKLWTCIDAIRDQGEIPCSINSAIPEVMCIEGIQVSMPDIKDFPSDLLNFTDDNNEKFIFVSGIDDVFQECFEKECLPKEAGTHWAKESMKVFV